MWVFALVPGEWICSRSRCAYLLQFQVCRCPSVPDVSICSSSWRMDLLKLHMTGFAPVLGKLICSSPRWGFLLQFQASRCSPVPYVSICSSSWRVGFLQFQKTGFALGPEDGICSNLGERMSSSSRWADMYMIQFQASRCPPVPYVSICSSSWRVGLLQFQKNGFAPVSGKLIFSSSRWA